MNLGASITLSVLAALVFGTGVAFQHRAAAAAPDMPLRLGLLGRLARDPWWLLGISCDGVGFLLMLGALATGPLVVVQPILMTAVVFSLAIHGLLTHHPLTRNEWRAVAGVAIGLVVFVLVIAPGEDVDNRASDAVWLLTMAVCAGLLAITIGFGFRAVRARRALLLGTATGIADAIMAVLAKAFATDFGDGVAAMATSWEPWALIVVGIFDLLLQQTAYQAGVPTVTLPTITVVDPVASSVLGVILFGEYLRLGGFRAPIAIVCIGGVLWCLASLCRSPSLAGGPDAIHPAGDIVPRNAT